MLPVGSKTRKRDIVAVLVVAAEVKVAVKVKVSLVDGVCVEGLAAAQAKDSGEHLSRRDVKGIITTICNMLLLLAFNPLTPTVAIRVQL